MKMQNHLKIPVIMIVALFTALLIASAGIGQYEPPDGPPDIPPGGQTYRLRVEVSPRELGTVEVSGPDGFLQSTSTQRGYTFPAGADVTLFAKDTTLGWEFHHWTGGNTLPIEHVTMNADMSITAYFEVGFEPWSELYGGNANLESALPKAREYRNKVIAANPQGKKLLTELYGKHSLPIAEIMLENPELLKRASELFKTHMPGIERALNGGKMKLNMRQLVKIKSFMRDLGELGTPELEAYTKDL